MPLAADRKTPERLSPKQVVYPVDAGDVIFKGAMVAIDSDGMLHPADDSIALQVVGMAEEHVDNSDGADGDLTCTVRRGVFRWANSSAGDAITAAHIGRIVYAEDDFTVALTSDSGGTQRPQAGRVYDVDSSGVWVDCSVAAFAGTIPGGSQVADIGALTDSTGQTPDNTIANVVAPSAAAGEATAADLTSTVAAFASVEGSLSDLADQVNAIRTGLRALGLMA